MDDEISSEVHIEESHKVGKSWHRKVVAFLDHTHANTATVASRVCCAPVSPRPCPRAQASRREYLPSQRERQSFVCTSVERVALVSCQVVPHQTIIMPPRGSPTTRGAGKKATPQELVQKTVISGEMNVMETELAETKAALAEALAAQGKLLSRAEGERLQNQVKQHETKRSQAMEESREALKKCSDMAQELAAERAKNIKLLEVQQREREQAEKMRTAFAGIISALRGSDLIPAATAEASVTSSAPNPANAPAPAIVPTATAPEAAPSPAPEAMPDAPPTAIEEEVLAA